MIKLIYLELERINLKPHVIGIFIANVIILILSIFASVLISMIESYIPELQSLVHFKLTTLDLSGMLVRAVLIIWEAVFLSQIIIDEYKGNMISMLYTYPYKRVKIIAAKMALVFILMICMYGFSELFQTLSINILSRNFTAISYQGYDIIYSSFINFASISLGLLPICVGMIKKSSIATILTSIIIVCMVSSSQGSTAGLISMPVIALFCGIIGLTACYFTVKKMINTDYYI